jgi:tape measure domain-containing protein
LADETGGDVILTAGLDTRPVLAQVQKLKEQLQKEFGSVRVGIQAAMGGATGAAGTRSAAGGVAASSAARSRAVNNVGALPDMTAQQRATQAYYDKLLGVTQAIKGEAEASARTIRIELANEKARQDAIRRSISLIETRQRLEARSSRIIPTDVRQAAGTLQYKFGLQGGAERDEARAAQLRGRQEEEGARRVWQMERDAEQARLKDAQLRWRQEEEGANRVWQMERDADQQRVKDAQLRWRQEEEGARRVWQMGRDVDQQRIKDAQLRWRQEDEGSRRVWQMQKDADADAIRQAQARTRLIENSQRLQAQFQQQQLQAQRVQITGGGAADNRLTNLQMRAERAIPSPSAGQALMGAPSQAEQIARIMGPATAAVDNYKKALAGTGATSLQTARAQVAMRQAFTVASAEIAKEGGLLRQLGAMRGMLGEMGRTIGGLGGTWQRFIINTQVAVQALLAFGGARQVFDIIASQQKLQAILTAVSTSAADQSSSMTQLRRVANEAGFSITELGNAYGQFLIAATKGGETLFTAQNQFEEIAKAARNLSLSTSDMDGVMRALQQMFSKGTVQSEELKLQLGDRIPVAMQAMAKAVQDVTGQATVNLDQMMKKGELVTSKFMGPFIHELFLMTGGADTFEKGSNSMMAGLGRLSNAFMDAAMAMNEGGFGAAVAQVSDKLAALLRSQETANLFSSIGAAIKFAADNAQYLLMILGGIIGIKIGVWAIEVAKTFGILYASLLPIIGALGVLMAALQAVDKLSRASTGQSMADKFRESQKALGLFSTDTIDAMAKGLDALTDPAKAANDALTAVGKGMGVVRDQAKSANEASNGLDAVMGRLGDVMSGIGDGSFDMANLGKIPADQLTEIYRDLQDKIGNANIQLKLGIDDRALRENLEREVGIAQDYLNKIGTNLSRRPPPPTINAPKVDKTEENRAKRVAELMRQQTLELQQQRDLNTAMAGGMAGTDFGDTLTSLAKINDDYKVRLELEKKDNDLGKDPAKRARLEHMIRERIELDRANKVMQDQLAIREQIDIAQVQGSVAGQNANQQELAVAAEQERLDLLKLGLRPMDEQYRNPWRCAGSRC